MKKTIIATMMFTAAAGAALFAGGADEDTAAPGRGGRGSAMGFMGEDGVEIVSLEGTVETDSYGNLIIDAGKTNYLVSPVHTMEVELEEGDVIDGEGFEGNTLYTKDGESYVNFYFTMATVDGEEYVIDLDKMARDGRDSKAGGSMGRERNDRQFNNEDGEDHMKGRGAYAFQEDSEEISLTGTIVLIDGDHPVLETEEGTYHIRMPRMDRDLLTEGAAVEATGYVGPSLHNEDGNDYYSFIATTLTVNGELIEQDFPMNGGMMGGRGGRRS